MKDADMYIFDDSFSALDFKTDAALRRALRGEVKESVALIIAQRINTILHADQIIVLDEGKIAGIGKHEELLDEKEIRKDPDTPVTLQETDGGIVFEHVQFGYTPDSILMEDISFTARPGEKIAVVGSAGAGKTTLINLLMRFYEVNGGRISSSVRFHRDTILGYDAENISAGQKQLLTIVDADLYNSQFAR